MTNKTDKKNRQKRALLLAKATAYQSGKDGRAIYRDKKSGKVVIPPLGKSNICKDGKNELLFSGIHNRTIFTGDLKSETDNLAVLRRIDSGVVDLIYLDPPFNSKRDYAAPVGSVAEGLDAFFTDKFARDNRWDGLQEVLLNVNPAVYSVIMAAAKVKGKSTRSYLTFMAVRLMEMHRVLKDTGSIYLHCDPTMSHYLKMLMDAIFGKDNFHNEIVWCYSKWTNTAKYYQKNHDIILFYSKADDYKFNKPLGEMTPSMRQIRERGYNGGSNRGVKILRVYDRNNPKAIKQIKSGAYDEIYYLDNPATGAPIPDYWNIPILGGGNRERTGYPTQKPLALLERIIKASSNKGDIVLDPFCGCGTALEAAQRHGRNWIGIDAAVSAGAVMIELREAGQGGLEENRDQINWRMISGDKQMPVRNDDGKTAIEYIPPKEPRRRLTAEERNAFLDDACKDGGGVCVGCGTKEHRDNLQVDHKDAFSKGGGNAFDNLQLLCDKCNGTKGTKTTEELWLILYETGRAISGEGAKYIVKALQGNLAK